MTDVSDPAGDTDGGRPDRERPDDGRPDDGSAAAAELLRALASALRIRIVTHLGEAGPHRVQDLVDHLGVAQPLVSQHLKVLRAAGIVRGERHGREIMYSLTDHHVAHIAADAVAHAREPR